MEVMMKPEQADDRKIFRIDNNEVTRVAQIAGEPANIIPSTNSSPIWTKSKNRPTASTASKPPQRTVFESQLMKLYDALNLYQRLKSASNRRPRTILRRNSMRIKKASRPASPP